MNLCYLSNTHTFNYIHDSFVCVCVCVCGVCVCVCVVSQCPEAACRVLAANDQCDVSPARMCDMYVVT